jgi:hypothetical protein
MHKQHLSLDSKTDDILQITKDIIGLHGTVPATSHLSLLARTKQYTREILTNALYVDKVLAKIKCFRRTLFILPEDLVPMVFAATKSLSQISPNQYRKYLGLSEEEYTTMAKTITTLLWGRHLTASEMKKELSATESLSRIINQMCDQGLLVRGMPKTGWKSNLHYYQLFNDLYPNINLSAYEEDNAIGLLIMLYIESYGPVSVTDITWWSGIKKTVVRQHLNRLEEWIVHTGISGMDGDFLMSRSEYEKHSSFIPPKDVTINLLPMLDPYVMGYKDRERYLDTKDYHYIFDRSGNAAPTILLNGQIIGVWDVSPSQQNIIKILLFCKDVPQQVIKQINRSASDIGNFISDQEVEIQHCEKMLSLHERTAGGFMTPLRNSVCSVYLK